MAGLALLAGGPAAALAANSGPTIGELNSGRVQVHPDSAVQSGAAKAMENYRQFLNLQNADEKLRAEALRRLGDLNLEGGELERMANEVTQIDIQGAEAIRLYSTLLKAYPNYSRNDQVLYQLARAYETTGQPEQALATLDLQIARYPSGRDYAEVQFRRGELLFAAKRYAEAQHAYEAVIGRGAQASMFYGQSLYKHGWSLFKQSMSEESLQSFAAVLDLTLTDPKTKAARPWESLGRADRELSEDTLRVMSITFTYLEGTTSLDEWVARRGRMPYAWLLYSRLGDLYVEKQRYQDAASTYRAFVGREPTDEHAPSLTMQAIEAYGKGGFADLVLDGKLEYVKNYGFDAPFWRGREHRQYPQLLALLKTNMKDVAQHYHATAQKSKKPEDYSAAAHWYRSYLGSFPDELDSADTNYLLADALFESRQYLDAAAEYEHTAYNYPQGARSAEAGYAALVAYQKNEEGLAAPARSEAHQHAIDASLRFVHAFPQHAESAGVLTRAAQDLYAAGDLTRASAAAQELLARVPPVDSAKQRIGWTIVGQVNFNQGAYEQAEAAFTQALASAAPGDTERGDITERLAAAVYKQAEARRSAGDEAAAAADFLRVARVAPGAAVVATSQYDAAAALINSKQWERAIEVLEAYRRVYPKGEYNSDVTRKLAVAYVESGHRAQAAAEYERIAANPTEDRAVVHEAIANAADLYEQSGNAARSVTMLERLVSEYPTPLADAIEVRARLAAAAAKSGNLERQRYWQQQIVKADTAAGPARTERSKYLAAQSQLALATPAREAFRAIKLVAPLKKSLVAKKQAMQAAVLAYKEVAAYQVASTTTAAAYETAELYRTLARDLLASERPKKLSQDELDQYQALLEEQAFPFEEQSISIHELNTARAHDGIYDEWVRQSYQALAELKPARYGKTERSIEVVATPTPTPAAAAILSEPLVTDFARAVTLMQASKNVEAELEFKQIELQNPDVAAAAIDLGLLARRAGSLAESEADLRRATEREPGNAIAWDELGLTLRQQGKFADARTAYEKAVAADAGYALAHRNLGVLLDLYVNEPTAALAEFERYRELSGEDKPISSWVAELRQRTGVKAPMPAAQATADTGGST